MKVRYKINGGGTETWHLANSYDETGRLAAKYLHSQNSGNFLQRMDYIYNIRGWLTQIDNPASFSENDKFGLKLYYNSAPTGGTAKYNGNIAGMGWGTTYNSNNNMLYRFTYDTSNRLTKADFYKSGIASGGLDVLYSYNNNGNIVSLTRLNKAGNYLDRLTISPDGNRISTITDLAGDVAGVTDYPGSTSQVGGYTYDGNGNLTQETNKLMSFNYNLLNLPREVSYWAGANAKIKYYYTFDGEKLRKTVENNGIVTKVDYCGPFVYETASGVRSLKYFVTPEGRAVKNGSTWDYEYNLKDHLGNTRVVIRKGSSGLAEVIQERHYYPFGMEMSELSYGTGSNRYLYNSKEIQNDFDLYWYDYGARFYDPMLGRWHSVDPMAEKYYFNSTYSYVSNNPILKFDPNGEDEWEVNSKGMIEWKNKSNRHQLFFVNNEGERTNSMEISDRSILDQLSQTRRKVKYMNNYGEERKAIVDEEGKEDVLKAFTFLSSNTNSEWKVEFAKIADEKQYGIGTYGFDDLSPGIFKRDKIVTSIHSHPNLSNNIKDEIDSMWGDRNNSFEKDYNFYVYMPKSTRLWGVRQGKNSYIRHIKNDYKRFINMD